MKSCVLKTLLLIHRGPDVMDQLFCFWYSKLQKAYKEKTKWYTRAQKPNVDMTGVQFCSIPGDCSLSALQVIWDFSFHMVSLLQIKFILFGLGKCVFFVGIQQYPRSWVSLVTREMLRVYSQQLHGISVLWLLISCSYILDPSYHSQSCMKHLSTNLQPNRSSSVTGLLFA